MTEGYSPKIDAYSHIAPAAYIKALHKIIPDDRRISGTPPLFDLDARFRIMDRYDGLIQVLTLSWPAIEEVAGPDKSEDLAKVANDGMAELVSKYPDRFVAAIAALPMNNVDAALKEADRAINDLKFRGVMVYSNVNGKPLDLPEFMPLYELMSRHSLPIYIHPQREIDFPDYRTEERSKFDINSVFGWPYDTTVVMIRLVFSGVLEKHPDLKILTHHCGGMVPYFQQRIVQHYAKFKMMVDRTEYMKGLTRSPIDYLKMFYLDTAIHGNTPALMCAYSFCGAEKMLFGADMPLGDPEFGSGSYRATVDAIEKMAITAAEKKKIFENNARSLLRLPI